MATTKKRKKKTDVKPVDSTFNVSRFMNRFVATTLLIILVIYFAIHAIGRTDGFRSMVNEKLEEITGLNALVESSSLDPFLNLKIHTIVCEDKEILGEPYLHADQIFINWKPFLGFSKKAIGKIEITGLKLKAVHDDKIWYPLICAPLKDKSFWLKSTSLENIIIDFFAKRAADNETLLDDSLYFPELSFPLRIYNADITWMKNAQVVEGHLKHCMVSAEKIDSNERKMEHYVLSCQQFLSPQTGPLNKVEFEWMHTENKLLFLHNGVTTKSHILEPSPVQRSSEKKVLKKTSQTPTAPVKKKIPKAPKSDLEQELIDRFNGALEN